MYINNNISEDDYVNKRKLIFGFYLNHLTDSL